MHVSNFLSLTLYLSQSPSPFSRGLFFSLFVIEEVSGPIYYFFVSLNCKLKTFWARSKSVNVVRTEGAQLWRAYSTQWLFLLLPINLTIGEIYSRTFLFQNQFNNMKTIVMYKKKSEMFALSTVYSVKSLFASLNRSQINYAGPCNQERINFIQQLGTKVYNWTF